MPDEPTNDKPTFEDHVGLYLRQPRLQLHEAVHLALGELPATEDDPELELWRERDHATGGSTLHMKPAFPRAQEELERAVESRIANRGRRTRGSFLGRYPQLHRLAL